MIDLRYDAYRYCNVYKRPFPRMQAGIGSWLGAFEAIWFLSVFANIALMALHPDVRHYFSNYNDSEFILLFVFGEVIHFSFYLFFS
jgi:hypothetical protein